MKMRRQLFDLTC